MLVGIFYVYDSLNSVCFYLLEIISISISNYTPEDGHVGRNM
jgi:hypothetical protein